MFRNLITAFFSPDTGNGGNGFPSLEQVNEYLGRSEAPAETPTETTPVTSEAPVETPEHSNTGEETPTETPTQEAIRMHKLKVDGVEREFTEQELYENASKGLDYTKKTQELAEQRKQVEKMEEFVNYVESNPVLANKMAKLIDDFQNGDISEKQFDKGVDKLQEQAPAQSQTDISEHPDFIAMKNKLAEFDSFKEQQTAAQQEAQIQSEIHTFLEEYPDLKENDTLRQEIFQHADDNGLNLRTAYRDKMFDQVANKTKEQMVKDNMRKQISATTPVGSSTGGKEAVSVPKSFADIRKSLLTENRNLSI